MIDTAMAWAAAQPPMFWVAVASIVVTYLTAGVVLAVRWTNQASIDNGGSPLKGVEGEYRMRMVAWVVLAVACLVAFWPAVLVIRFLVGIGQQLAGGLS